MNEVESQEAEIQWVDSDVDNDSDASDSDGTDGEVPDVTDDTPQTNLTNNPLPPGRSRIPHLNPPRMFQSDSTSGYLVFTEVQL